ncbi:SufE family protein [Candidatus Neomarinimicrobiota bacterium]
MRTYTLKDFQKYLDDMRAELNSARKNGVHSANQFLMDYGNTLGVFPNEWKTSINKVSGCSSKVYINAICANETMYFNGFSDSKMTKGQMAILINGINGLTIKNIIFEVKPLLEVFIKASDVRFSLTVNRTNSLGALFEFIKKKTAIYQ